MSELLKHGLPLALITALALASSPAAAQEDAEARAAATEAKMTEAERQVLPAGNLAMALFPGFKLPEGANFGAGFVPGVPRLNVPALLETDAALGVAWVGGARGPEGATPLPSGLALASSWNPELVRKGSAMIGAEAKAKGFNVLLGGGINLTRDPRNGRNFEYLGEDPLLSGVLGGEAVLGVQSNHMISTVKHYALNAQETGRNFLDARISDAAFRESDLLAFQIAIERGNPGSIMCAYNKVNSAWACENDYLLNKVLKRDWRYKGYVMSDWGATHSLEAALHGLDQQSGKEMDAKPWFGQPLRDAAAKDPAYAARLRDINRRILYAIYANGLDKHPPVKKPIDVEAGLAVAQEAAAQGIVLLRNERGALPLAASAKKIVVIGGYADGGVLSGGGSTQVQLTGGPAVTVPSGAGPISGLLSETYHRSSPLAAITAKAPKAAIKYVRGNYVSEAVEAARNADVAIVFATEWRTEAFDVPDLNLPNGQNELIAAVASANPNTIVVLETGGPVLMPWLDKTAGVLQAWYPGGRGGPAIASVLFGETNPSGHLPLTFPASLDQLPRPRLDGAGLDVPLFGNPNNLNITVDYDIEGSDVGYRWNARKGHKALFPFGFGLSYTRFEHANLAVKGLSAQFTVTNTGTRPGADVAQLYLVGRPDGAKQRLVGFQRADLAPGERRQIAVQIDPRLLADWNGKGWTIKPGTYQFALGTDAEHLGAPVSVRMSGRSWTD